MALSISSLAGALLSLGLVSLNSVLIDGPPFAASKDHSRLVDSGISILWFLQIWTNRTTTKLPDEMSCKEFKEGADPEKVARPSGFFHLGALRDVKHFRCKESSLDKFSSIHGAVSKLENRFREDQYAMMRIYMWHAQFSLLLKL
ncbi:hypothetical protein SELMODRAFT_424397 [Selaginella moellendorffii]|uniref:Uncharacterized protein n=1 Tax=Selaginella moellendorffii TaxID=88036 RepID=D8SPR7_SELML|nr:hypothetical protein SELMODRAFT_424397 [Selaginella moellendorffii]